MNQCQFIFADLMDFHDDDYNLDWIFWLSKSTNIA